MTISTLVPIHRRSPIFDAQLQLPPGNMEHSIVRLRPPYERAEPPAGWAALVDRDPLPGTVLGIQINRPVDDFSKLDATVRALRSRSPITPIVLLIELPLEDGLYVTAHAARVGVRAILSPGAVLKDGLRKSMTEGVGLAGDVVDWLTVRGLKLSPLVSSLVLHIVGLAPHHENLTSLLACAGVPETSARFRMHKKRLPSPSRWFQAARALHAAMRIQAEPETGLLRIAHRLGYADHSALSQLVYRAFGVRPGAIRGTLGWEWLMERWIVLQGIRVAPREPIGQGVARSR